jgi:formylmethanofuran dehydrogenase subunit E
MGLHAAELIELDLQREPERRFALVEMDGCFADAVAVATGCRLGKRNLRLFDYGKVALTLVDVLTERSVRVHPHRLARARAAAYAPEGTSRWDAQLRAYQHMPIEELVCAEPVRLAVQLADLMSPLTERIDCSRCGEEVMNARHASIGGQRLCRPCASGSYYRAEVALRGAWTGRAA